MGKVLKGVRLVTTLALLGLLAGPIAAHASLIFGGIVTGQIGVSNVVLTIQNTGTESGCVAWNGTADVVGSGACPGGLSPAIIGGNEKTGNSQTQTQTVGQTGVVSGGSLVVIIAPVEGSPLLTVENLSLTVFASTGAVLFNSGNLFGAPVTLDTSLLPAGALGFGFLLDSTQAALINPFINANNRIGLATLLANTDGGNDTFSVADAVNVSFLVPEPATLALLGLGLAGLGFARRRGRSH